MLANSGISQCLNFYSIKDNQKPDELEEDKDFFVGSNVDITLTIPNGETIQVRDIVVLGKLTIQSTNIEDTSTKGSLIARDIFTPGDLSLKNVSIEAQNWYQPENGQKFQQELQNIIIDWFKSQKESTDKIGLKSVLIKDSNS